MENLYSIIALVIVFALVIVVHEFGHMIAALASNVDVTDFALGLGPSLFTRKIRGVNYHICALPLGGFVKISGMEQGDPETERSYRKKRPPSKIFILSAGAIMNFLLGVILIFVLAFIGFPKEVVIVREVVPGGPAYEVGFKAGDIVLSINGERVKDQSGLRSIISNSGTKPINFLVERHGEKIELSVSPRTFNYINAEGNLVPYNDGKPSIGLIHSAEVLVTTKVAVVVPNSEAAKAGIKPGDKIVKVNDEDVALGSDLYYFTAGESGLEKAITLKIQRGKDSFTTTLPTGTTINSLGILFESETERLPFLETVKRALYNVYNTTRLFIYNLKLLGTKEGIKLLSGPVAIGTIIAQSAKSSLYTLIQIAMIITINLGIINLLPIPPLDGGRIFFVLLELVGLNVQERKRYIADVVGMVLLISLILVLTLRDVVGLIKMSF